MGVIVHRYREGTLTRWPSTISELNSDWSSARGRLFFGFMLSTAALLFASRMPYELDTVKLEEEVADADQASSAAGQAADDRHVCCLADCGPACDWPFSAVCAGQSGCIPVDCVAGLLWRPVHAVKRATGVEDTPICCTGPACGCIEESPAIADNCHPCT